VLCSFEIEEKMRKFLLFNKEYNTTRRKKKYISITINVEKDGKS
jgi:hypothetical protein